MRRREIQARYILEGTTRENVNMCDVIGINRDHKFQKKFCSFTSSCFVWATYESIANLNIKLLMSRVKSWVMKCLKKDRNDLVIVWF